MFNQANDRIEELRQAGLARVRAEDYEQALAIYDEALALAQDEEQRELLVINKADVLIALDRSGAEVQQLPTILMRRRNPHHVFLAAYALMYKHRLRQETKRAIFYGEIALDTANESDQPFWKLAAHNDLGINYEIDSQFERAIECFEQALALIDAVSATEQQFGRAAIVGNLGYNKLLVGETAEGIRLIESVLDAFREGTLAEAYIDLCYGYVDLSEYVRARSCGELGLALAADPRQTRNAHYLLGEVAYKLGDVEQAEFHFEQLAKFYPQFRNLKSLLFAIDLRGMVNLKL
ncbi:MAG: tetratricopeptide repeat protein [Acidobacteriota bacterium]